MDLLPQQRGRSFSFIPYDEVALLQNCGMNKFNKMRIHYYYLYVGKYGDECACAVSIRCVSSDNSNPRMGKQSERRKVDL